MPTVAYAMSDLIPSDDGRHGAGHIHRPVHAGGCGQEHEVQVDHVGRAFIECDRCAPSLIGSHYGWAARPGDVPLTCDEVADQELAERDAKGAQNTLLKGMTEAFVRALQGGSSFPGMAAAPAPKSLVEQLSDMSPAERAQLAALLAPPAPPGAVEVTAAHGAAAAGGAHVLTPPAPEPGAARVVQPAETVKRGPGRPRKNP